MYIPGAEYDKPMAKALAVANQRIVEGRYFRGATFPLFFPLQQT